MPEVLWSGVIRLRRRNHHGRQVTQEVEHQDGSKQVLEGEARRQEGQGEQAQGRLTRTPRGAGLISPVPCSVPGAARGPFCGAAPPLPYPVGMPANLTPLRVAIVPGVNPGKWTRAWSQRRKNPIEVTPILDSDQRSVLTDHSADVAFVRLPIDSSDLSVVRLYEEVTVAVVPVEHPISLFDAVTLADLDGETIRTEPLEDAIDLVVAGVGILVLPHAVARQHARRD